MEEMNSECPYKNNGFDCREDYIADLKEQYPPDLVDLCMSFMPASEDFDGLVIALENAFETGEWDW